MIVTALSLKGLKLYELFVSRSSVFGLRSSIFGLRFVDTHHQPGTFKCARVRFRTCPFISNANKISGPKRTVAITDHFSCISTNLIYCITCTLCKEIYIGETGRRLGDRSANTLGMLRLTIKTLLNQSRDISTSRTILKNTWRFVAFLSI